MASRESHVDRRRSCSKLRRLSKWRQREAVLADFSSFAHLGSSCKGIRCVGNIATENKCGVGITEGGWTNMPAIWRHRRAYISACRIARIQVVLHTKPAILFTQCFVHNISFISASAKNISDVKGTLLQKKEKKRKEKTPQGSPHPGAGWGWLSKCPRQKYDYTCLYLADNKDQCGGKVARKLWMPMSPDLLHCKEHTLKSIWNANFWQNVKRKSILQHWEGRGFLPLPPKQESGSQRERNTQVALALFIASRNE